MNDVHLELLKTIDRKVDNQGTALECLRSDMTTVRITSAQHHARIEAVEREQKTCAERVKQGVREVLDEQRETDRLDRKPKGETTGLVKSLAKIGTWAKYALLAGVFVGGVIAGISLTRPVSAPSTQGHAP